MFSNTLDMRSSVRRAQIPLLARIGSQPLSRKPDSKALRSVHTHFNWLTSDQLAQLDGIATHYYSNSASDFITFMDGFIGTFPGDRIYLTEFSAQVFLFIILCISATGG